LVFDVGSSPRRGEPNTVATRKQNLPLYFLTKQSKIKTELGLFSQIMKTSFSEVWFSSVSRVGDVHNFL
jgi:hypothetical protein